MHNCRELFFLRFTKIAHVFTSWIYRIGEGKLVDIFPGILHLPLCRIKFPQSLFRGHFCQCTDQDNCQEGNNEAGQ